VSALGQGRLPAATVRKIRAGRNTSHTICERGPGRVWWPGWTVGTPKGPQPPPPIRPCPIVARTCANRVSIGWARFCRSYSEATEDGLPVEFAESGAAADPVLWQGAAYDEPGVGGPTAAGERNVTGTSYPTLCLQGMMRGVPRLSDWWLLA